MEEKESLEEVKKYRQNLIVYGKKVVVENPDKLTSGEMIALEERIFRELNKIDMASGLSYHDVGMTIPKGITQEQQEELYMEFLDWYQVIPTPSGEIYEYVTQNYPTSKYPKILCVGDGMNCHLGRKLAMKGHSVVSVDPEARKQFSGRLGSLGGKLHVVKGKFFKTSTDMIEWADLIVGSKVPQCAEDLVQVSKPTVFNISNNAEIYKMNFKGSLIHSSEQLMREIVKCPGVSLKSKKNIIGESNIFVCEGRINNKEREM